MSRDFFHNTEEEFDESKHLSSREIWEGIAKNLMAFFNDIMYRFEIGCHQKIEGAAGTIKHGQEMGLLDDNDVKKIEGEVKILAGKLEAIKEYDSIYLDEEGAWADKDKNPKKFLECRKRLTWEQEKMVGIFKEEFLSEILKIFKELVDSTAAGQLLNKFESGFINRDGGILPVRKGTGAPKNSSKEIHPEFLRTLNESSLGANVLSEGFFKLLKQEREIIDERLYGGKKERHY